MPDDDQRPRSANGVSTSSSSDDMRNDRAKLVKLLGRLLAEQWLAEQRISEADETRQAEP